MTSLLETVGPRNGPAPLTYELTELGTVDLQSAFAHFDGAAASGAWRPTLTVRAQNGTILARVFPSTQLAVGDAADVTFAPFLDRGDGSSGSSPAPGGLAQAIRAFNTVNQSVPNNTWTAAQFTSTSYEYGGLSFDAGTPDRITVTQAGIFVAYFHAIFAPNAAGVRYAAIGLNGVNGSSQSSQLPQGDDRAGVTNYTVQATAILNLAAGDYVQGWVYQDSGGPLNIVPTGGLPPGGVALSLAGWFLT